MMDFDERFDRGERLFGKEGQEKLRRACVAVVGVGGLGTHVVQQLALLGVGTVFLLDHEELSRSNRNRYIGAWHDDPIPGFAKVDLGERLIGMIDPSIRVRTLREHFPSTGGLKALRETDYVFGCLDHDGVRFVLNEACLAYQRPLIDLASDVPEPGCYGGRVIVVTGEGGCLYCREELDPDEVRRFLSPREALENEAAVYGIKREVLGEAGPAVVSVNGVIASLGVTEFMAMATGLRTPCRRLEYRGDRGVVGRRNDTPSAECHYCNGVRGQGDGANLERYCEAGAVAA